MRNVLIFAGAIVSIYFVFVLQAFFVWKSQRPEVWMSYWLGIENVKFVFIGGFVLFSLHITLVIRAVKQKKIEWHWAIPLVLMPYMMSVILQGLLF